MKQLVKLAICLLLILFGAELSSAQQPELVVQTGHSRSVESVAFSPDGKLLASGSFDKTIKLWDVASGQELRTLSGHADSVTSIAFSPDGKLLASGDNKTIKLWNVVTGKEVRTLSTRSVASVAFSPDGKLLVSGSYDNSIKLGDVATGQVLRTLSGHTYSVKSVAFSPDGKLLASGSDDKTIKLWDVATGQELHTLSGHTDSVESVAFSPDGKLLASGSEDKTIKLWDVASAKELRTLKGHSYVVSSVAFSPDGKLLASASLDNTVKLWDVATGRQLRTLRGHTGWVNCVTFSPDGKLLADGSEDKTIKLWDVTSGQELRTLSTHADSIALSVFSPDGKLLASGSDDNTVKLWDLASGQGLRTLSGHTDIVDSVAFSPDGKLLASASLDNTVKLWDVATGRELRTFRGHTSPVFSVAFSPDGKTLASGSWDKTIKLWDVTSGAELRTLRGHTDWVTSVAFSLDGKLLASGSGDLSVKVWDLTSGQELRTLRGYTDWILYVGFSPDGKLLASGSLGKIAKLWDLATGQELILPPQIPSWIRLPIIDRINNQTIAAQAKGAKMILIDVATKQEIVSLITLDQKEWVAITPDGLFDGSPAAWNHIIWRFNNNTFNYAPVEAFFSDFYYPGLLADIFAGKHPKAPSDISQKDRRQPQLKLTLVDVQPNATLTTRNVTVKIDVSQAPAGGQDLRLFRNGSLVKVWHGEVLKGQSSVTLEATVPIVAGPNNFTAYAFNHDNIKSSDATLVVNGADSLKRQGTAYILAVGINNYSNTQYNLKYAVADAQDFSAEVKRQQELLKRYAQVEVISLSDTEATKANITQKLAQLATRVQPEDAVIIYFAGHGTAHGKQFYLIPHDLGYTGARENLNEAGLQTILDHSISDRELEKLFEGLDAGQLLLVIDACNSGQALEAEEKRRGPMNSKGLAQLAYEKGMYVLTAAQSYQAAKEAARFGHGFLTYALVEEGLKQGKADREPKDRAINLREWLNYATEEVPKMQEQNSLEALRGRGRYLVFVGDGSPPRNVGLKVDARDNVQRPRLFYRRELDSNPLVVAIVGATPRQ